MYNNLYIVYKSIPLNSLITILNLIKLGLKQMKSEKLVITFVWTFVLVIIVGYLSAGILWTDYNMMVNVFNVGLLLFFIASLFTGAIVCLTSEKVNGEPKLIDEMQNLRLKLDELTSEFKRIRRLSSH